MNNLIDQVVTQATGGDSHPPSPYQAAFYTAITASSDNLLIQAVAGSGKTTTIIQGMGHTQGTALFLAFNKSIATEIASRLSRGEARTLNSLGHRVLMQNVPRAQLNMNKLRDIVDKMRLNDPLLYEYGYQVTRAIGLVKNNGFGLPGYRPVDEDAFSDMIDQYDLGVPFEQLKPVAERAYTVWTAAQRDRSTFDFDDQLYLPILEGWDFPRVDNVFADEYQDFSPVQHEMMQQLVLAGSRLFAVGDRYQAIYGFRGAATNSMDLGKKMFNMKEMPLSICYRCPRRVVLEAKTLCPEIQWKDGAPEGIVAQQYDPDLGQFEDPELFHEGLILSRTNAPLFKVILRHVRARKPCRVLSSFLDSFQSWIRGFRKTYCRDLLPRLDSWYEREQAALRERNAGAGRFATLKDKYDTAVMLAKEFGTVAEMLEMLKSLSTSSTGPIFSTIHKAKGLEEPKVYLLRPDLCPVPWVEPESEAMTQERNLKYVAITRAQQEFTYGVPQPY